MSSMPKMLITIGIILIVVGLIWQVGGRFLPIGKLPGDILIKKENVTFYFPIMTSIIVSIVLSLIFYILTRFR